MTPGLWAKSAKLAVRVSAVALALQACTGARAVPARPEPAATHEPTRVPTATDAGRATQTTASVPDAAVARDAASAPAPVAPDASTPKPSPSFVSLGLDARGHVQVCPRTTRFVPLASLVAKPAAGQVRVRGRLWTPSVYPCTATLAEQCIGYLVLARRKPTARTDKQVDLLGNLAADKPLACIGPRGHLRCPFPADGREYGVAGQLSVDGNTLTIHVESICRPAGRR